MRAGTPDHKLFHQATIIVILAVTLAIVAFTVAIIVTNQMKTTRQQSFHHRCFHRCHHCDQPDENHCDILSSSCSGLLSSLFVWLVKPPTPSSPSSGGISNCIAISYFFRGTFPSGSKGGRLCLLLDKNPYDSKEHQVYYGDDIESHKLILIWVGFVFLETVFFNYMAWQVKRSKLLNVFVSNC